MQFAPNDSYSRTYLDFDTPAQAMEGLVQVYEQRLEQSTDGGKVNYEMRDIVMFIDNLADLSCMVFDETQKIYLPYGKDWIKSRIYGYLKQYATKDESFAN